MTKDDQSLSDLVREIIVSNGKQTITEDEDPRLVAVIPAGGQGRGMEAVSRLMPKTLIPLDDKPILIHILKSLDNQFFKKVIILCNDWQRMIEAYVKAFKQDFNVDVECIKITSREKNVNKFPSEIYRELVRTRSLTDPFLLHYSDIKLYDIEWDDFIRSYRRAKRKMGIVAQLILSSFFQFHVGLVGMGEHRIINEFDQKPDRLFIGKLINCGVALVGHEFVHEYVTTDDEADIFNTIIQKVVTDRRVAGYPLDKWDHFQRLGDILDAQKRFYPHLD